ncbi:retention module-containing protein [Buttiauxella sp.]|uniref:retention module-containing protein n=1 Tax=Buttiauxella sp. TaxID=1972222 RepID=UPI003C75CDA2
MSNLLGVIRAVIGQVYVVAADGSQRLLKEGDRIYSGEEIVTGDSGAVSVSLPDGKTLDLGRNSHWTEHGLNAVSSGEHDTQDVASLQKAIADGADPTQALEATAAGNEPPVQIEGGGGGHTLVQLDMTGQIIDPTAGFKTQGIGAPTWTHELPEGAQTAGSPPVLPPLVQIDDFAGNDGFINKNEINHATINGTSNQNHVTLTFTDSQKNTLTFDVEVKNGHWTTQPDLSGLVEGEISVTATATDVSGRTAHSTADAIIDVTDLHDNITIDNVTPDNVINIAESHNARTSVHGTVSGDAKIGDKITLTVNGHEYTDVVIDLGNGALGYRIDVSTQGLLADPNIHATVTSTDEAGNTTQASSDHHVDIDLDVHNTISIGTVANDDIVNATESRMPTMITGLAGGDAQAGDPVTVTVGGRDFHGVVVNNNGQLSYEVPVPTQLLKEGANDVTVQLVSHDAAGNEAIATEHKTVVLDTQAHNALIIDTVAGDDTVNTAESRMPTLISGVVSGDAQAGDRVVVSVNGHEYRGEVVTAENGSLRYEIPVPTSALNEGNNDVQVMVTGVDAAGNTAIAVEHKNVVLDTHAENHVIVQTVAGDNIVNATEARMPTMISGVVSGDAQAGDKVVVSVNGQNFYGDVTVDEHGQLRYEVPVPTNALTEGSNDVQVMVTGVDASGNTAMVVEHKNVVLDTHAGNGLTIKTVAGDNVVNHLESQRDTFITGRVSGADAKPGDRVVVHVQGKDFVGEVTADSAGHLHYKVPVPVGTLAEGHNKVSVMVISHDAAGNEAIAVEHTNVTLDTHADATITIDPITKDNILNHDELDASKQFVHGKVGGDAKPGDVVDLEIHGKHYSGNVIAIGPNQLGYQIAVDPKDFSHNQGDVDGFVKVIASVKAHDAAGNEVVETTEHNVQIDNHANATITIDDVTKDNTLNHDELNAAQQFVHGNVGGDARAGDVVDLEIRGKHFTGSVVDFGNGQSGYNIAVEPSAFSRNKGEIDGDVKIHATIKSHDDAGNVVVQTAVHSVHIDNHANTTITIENVTKDNVLNHDELAAKTQFIHGVVDGDAKVHDRVDIEIKGNHFKGEVIDLGNGQLGYNIPVDPRVFSNNKGEVDGKVDVHAKVTSHDGAGNVAIATQVSTVNIDNHANATITIEDVTKDNVLNHDELTASKQMISGMVGGDAKAGDVVSIEVRGHQFTGEVVPVGNGLGYHIEVDSALFSQNLGEVDDKVHVLATVKSHDAAGNVVVQTREHTVYIDNHANATITVDSVTDDNSLNHTELEHQTQTITGTVGGDAKANDPVILTINGNQHTGLVVETPDGRLVYSIEVPTSEFGNNQSEVNADKPFTVQVTSHDKANNEVVVTTDHRVHLDNHAENSVIIKTVAGDNVVNNAEHQHDTDITGHVSGKDAKAGDVVEVTVDGKSYFGTVFEGAAGRLLYNVPVPRDALHEGKNDVQVKVSSYDKAGNEAIAIAHQNVDVDTAAHASITIENVTKDNVLNHSELGADKQWIHGKVGLDARPGDVVDIQIGTQHIYGKVITFDDNSLGYRIPVNPSLLSDNKGEVDGNVTFHVSVTSHDKAGNVVTVTEEHTVGIDNHANATIDIKDVTQDNVLNHSELDQSVQTITGDVHGDAREGDKVTLEVDGQRYFGRVVELTPGHLGYKIDVKSSDFSDNKTEVDKDVKITVKVDSHDDHGNLVTAHYEHTVSVDNHANATLTIADVTQDNLLNHSELAKDTQMISGIAGGDAKEGDRVVITFNGTDYPGTVGKDLSYHIEVKSSEFGNNKAHLDQDLTFTAKITSHDDHGNEVIVITDHKMHIDNFAVNDFTIETVAGDDWVSAIESRSNTIIRGAVWGDDAKFGDKVTVRVTGHDASGKEVHHDYSGVVHVDSNGNLFYSVPVPPGGLYEGLDTVKVSITSSDLHGNSVTTSHSHDIAVDTHADATIQIDNVTADDVLNYNELDQPKVTITGVVGGDAKVGDDVVIEIHGDKYPGKVIPVGNGLGFSIEVDSYAISDNHGKIDGDVKFTASVTSYDELHNKVTKTTEHTVHIDNHADGNITMGPVTGDNIINHHESREHTTKITGTVSGSTSGEINEGDKVTITVNNHTYETTVIKLLNQHGALGYSVDVSTKDLLADPNPIAHVVAHDAAGNQDHFTFTNQIGIDLQAEATITIDKVTGDDMINGKESDKEFTTVSGTVGGDVKEGDVVHLVINGNELTTEVTKDTHGNLVWSKPVSTHDLMVNPHFTATVTGTDNANNTATANADRTVVVDLKVEAEITVNSVTSDNTLNNEELNHHYSLVSGTVKGEMKPGDDLTLKINGHEYHGTVELNSNGDMVYNVMVETTDLHQDPNIHASISVTDKAQNSIVATADHHVNIDDHASASLTINVVSGDDILNHLDQKHPTTTINGTVGGDVHQGDTVHVWVDGVEYKAAVEPQPHLNNALGYSVEVRTAGLLANGHIEATVSTEDKAGNTITVHADHDVTRDDGAQATISIGTVSGDDWINNVDAHQQYTTITGKVTGDVHIGDIVDLEVNNQHYTGKVVSEGKGHGLGYSIDVSTDDLLSGSDKPVLHASVTGYDAAGNTVLATASHAVGIDTRAEATIDITPGSVHVNGTNDFWVISGNVGGDAKIGDVVTITVGSKTVQTTVEQFPDGHLGYNADHTTDPLTGNPAYINPSDVGPNSDIVVKITTTDDYGNTETATDHIVAHGNGHPTDSNTGGTTTPDYDPPHAEITISPIAGNDVINKAESEKGTTTIRGTVEGDVKAGEFVTLHIGDQDMQVKIVERPNLPGELGYEVEVDTKLLMAHPDISVTAHAHNGAGETADSSVQKTVHVDTLATAEIHLDNIAVDDVINILESQSGTTTVSGIVKGDGIHDGSNVTIMVNGNPVTTQVHTDSKGVMRFSKDVSVDDLRHTPTITVSVTGQDQQGNTFTATDGKTITVDTEVKAEVTIDKVTDDNILNLHETQQPTTTITGHVSGDVNPGEYVTLTVNGQVYQNIEIGKDLSYSVNVKTSDLQPGNEIKAEVTGHDEHGNTTTGSAIQTYSTDISAAATIHVNTVSGDNILSAKDLGADKTGISGTVGGDAAVGDKVTVMLNGVTETADVVFDNLTGKLVYTLEVNTDNLKAELASQHTDKPEIIVTVTGQDNAGNDFSQSESKTITIDDHANVTLTVDKVAGDNILNIDESNQSTTQISGTVTGDVKEGGSVILTVNGNERPATLHSDGHGGFTFKLDVPTSDLLTNQEITYKVTGVDAVGNTLTVTDTTTLTIDHDVKNEVHIGTVAGDDKVNIEEHSHATTMVTGTVAGDAQDGDTVTLMLNGKPVPGAEYQLQGGEKTFAIAVDNSLLTEGNNKIDVSFTGHDTSGNVYTSTDTHTITLDTTIGANITLQPVATDDVINAKEADSVSIKGTVDGDAQPGDTVAMTVNGQPYSGTLDDHKQFDIPVLRGDLREGGNSIVVDVPVKDDAGNTFTAHTTHDVLMDTQLRAEIHLDNVAGNNVINAQEVDHVSVTGTIDRDTDAQLGDHVMVTVNGKSFPGVVGVINGHLGYAIPVDKALLHEGKNTFDVSISATDKAGNAITVHDSHDVLVDTHADAKITINNVTRDNHIDSQEARHHVTHITGQIDSADVHNNEHISVTINHKPYDAVLHEENGHLTYDVPVNTHELHIGKNSVDVSVTAHDDHGNTNVIHQTSDFTMDDPSHRGKHDVDTAGKAHHAAGHDHGLSNLFDDSNDALSFNLSHDAKAHPGRDDTKVFTGKDDSHHDKIDLSDLAHQLHEETDIAQLIKGGSEPHAPKGDAANPAHPVHSAPDMSSDSHGSSHYSLDHLIPKPEHYHS